MDDDTLEASLHEATGTTMTRPQTHGPPTLTIRIAERPKNARRGKSAPLPLS